MMHKQYFVGGASGSGKTSIIADLQNTLGKTVNVYDFDAIGVPKDADKIWRQKSTEKWLQKLLNDNKNSCLLGQIVLGEILASPSAKKFNTINFCLLDVSDFQRAQRLKKRDAHAANQDMLNWSSWLRMHCHDPQWEQHVLKDNCWAGLDFTYWDQLSDWSTVAHVASLDTTSLSIKDTADNVVRLIKNCW